MRDAAAIIEGRGTAIVSKNQNFRFSFQISAKLKQNCISVNNLFDNNVDYF